MQSLREDHGRRARYDRCRERPSWASQPEPLPPTQMEQLATSVGDAVTRLIRAFDPARASLGGRSAMAERQDQGWDRGWERGSGRPHRRRDDWDDCGHDHRGHGCGCGHDWDDCGHDHHRHGCGCGHDPCCSPRCGPDPCHCSCCIGDVDLVIYARVGETRVIPISIENPRSRERAIEVVLSDFTTKGGNPTSVVGQVLAPSSFVLAPCSEHEAVIVVRVGVPGAEAPTERPAPSAAPGLRSNLTKAQLEEEARQLGLTGAEAMSKAALVDALNAASAESSSTVDVDDTSDRPTRRLRDVDDCHVAVADLRIQGCDTRPLRIAVAVLPRDCGPYEVRCGSRCC